MSREEYNLPLTAESYAHLKAKADGNIISKRRYLIPLSDGLTIELDVFATPFDGLWLAEVEFESEEQANTFTPPSGSEKRLPGLPNTITVRSVRKSSDILYCHCLMTICFGLRCVL